MRTMTLELSDFQGTPMTFELYFKVGLYFLAGPLTHSVYGQNAYRWKDTTRNAWLRDPRVRHLVPVIDTAFKVLAAQEDTT